MPLKKFTHNQAVRFGNQLGINWKLIDRDQFHHGFNAEREHSTTVRGNKKVIARIALDHLREDPGYYTKLQKIEHRKSAAPSYITRSELMRYKPLKRPTVPDWRRGTMRKAAALSQFGKILAPIAAAGTLMGGQVHAADAPKVSPLHSNIQFMKRFNAEQMNRFKADPKFKQSVLEYLKQAQSGKLPKTIIRTKK